MNNYLNGTTVLVVDNAEVIFLSLLCAVQLKKNRIQDEVLKEFSFIIDEVFLKTDLELV